MSRSPTKIATGQVVITPGTASEIVPARPGRVKLFIFGPQVALGMDSSVTTDTGFQYALGGSLGPMQLETQAAVYGAAYPGTGPTTTVSFLETFD
jgi:hypothetical protein